MSELSIFRLYLMRATYLLLVIGLGLTIWPDIIDHQAPQPMMDGVVASLLGAVAVLGLVGLRYPAQMLPLLLFELVWKSIWLLAYALPLYLSDRLDAQLLGTVYACLMGIVIFPIAIPWRYVVAHYLKKTGDRWLLTAIA